MANSGAVKSVLVTGADGALGSVVAKRFADAGIEVYATYFNRKPERPGEGGWHWIQADLSDPNSVKAALKGLKVDALVHCAGGFRFAKTEDLVEADLEFLIDANLKSGFHLARELLPGMRQRGFGRIVFVSARATFQPSSGMGAYAASKAGLNALTLALADEVRAENINVNAVLPTVLDTPANRKEMAGADFSKWVTPAKLAEILFSLTQPWGDPIHGALIPVSGRL